MLSLILITISNFDKNSFKGMLAVYKKYEQINYRNKKKGWQDKTTKESRLSDQIYKRIKNWQHLSLIPTV